MNNKNIQFSPNTFKLENPLTFKIVENLMAVDFKVDIVVVTSVFKISSDIMEETTEPSFAIIHGKRTSLNVPQIISNFSSMSAFKSNSCTSETRQHEKHGILYVCNFLFQLPERSERTPTEERSYASVAFNKNSHYKIVLFHNHILSMNDLTSEKNKHILIASRNYDACNTCSTGYVDDEYSSFWFK